MLRHIILSLHENVELIHGPRSMKASQLNGCLKARAECQARLTNTDDCPPERY